MTTGRRLALLVCALAACKSASNKPKDGGPGTDGQLVDGKVVDGSLADAPPLAPCTPTSGTKVTARKIGKANDAAMLATSPPADPRLFTEWANQKMDGRRRKPAVGPTASLARFRNIPAGSNPSSPMRGTI